MRIKSYLKRVSAIILGICFLFVTIPLVQNDVFAISLDDRSIYDVSGEYKSGDCNLASNVYMLRRAAINRGSSSWKNITLGSLRSKATSNGKNAMKNNYNHEHDGVKYSISHGNLSGTVNQKTQTLEKLLASHPEGIVVWGGAAAIDNSHKKPYSHAVLITKYSNGTFYCADPTHNKGNYNKGIETLENSTIIGLDCLTGYWYLKSASEPKCEHNYTTKYETAHPHYMYKQCTKCGETISTQTTGYSADCKVCRSSNKCGENVTWSYNEENHTVYITGTGKMADFSVTEGSWGKESTAPWAELNPLRFVVEEGVTTIGNYAFYNESSDIFLPKSISSIGTGAFSSTDDYEDARVFGYSGKVKNAAEKAKRKFYDLGVIEKQLCGRNLKWDFNRTTGALTISGTGPMHSFITSQDIQEGVDENKVIVPWERFKREIRKVVIGSGVTSIGKGVFAGMTLNEVSIANTVTEVDDYAFYGSNLVSLDLPGSVKRVGKYAFTQVQSITLHEGLETIDDYGLPHILRSPSILRIPDTVKKIGTQDIWSADWDEVSANPSIVYGKKGSYAEKWVQQNEHKMKFVGRTAGTAKMLFFNETSGELEIQKPSLRRYSEGNREASFAISGSVMHGWTLYRSTSKSGEYEKVGSGKAGRISDDILYKKAYISADKIQPLGKTYYYKVRTYVKLNGKTYYSPYSDPVKRTIKPNSTRIRGVAKLKSGHIKVSFYYVQNIDAYQIYRSTRKTGGFKLIKTVSDERIFPSVTDTGVHKGKTYYYKVRTYATQNGKKIYSEYSPVVGKKV